MLIQVFTIYDSKAEIYLKPFHCESIGVALRSLMDVLEDPKHEMTKHSEDFTLFHLGDFDNKKGKYTQFQTPKSVGTVLEYKTQKPNPNTTVSPLTVPEA